MLVLCTMCYVLWHLFPPSPLPGTHHEDLQHACAFCSQVTFFANASPVSPEQEADVLAHLSTTVQRRLQAYKVRHSANNSILLMNGCVRLKRRLRGPVALIFMSKDNPSAATHACLSAVQNPISMDMEIMDSPTATPRQKVASRLLKIEKEILLDTLEQLGGPPATPTDPLPHLKLN